MITLSRTISPLFTSLSRPLSLSPSSHQLVFRMSTSIREQYNKLKERRTEIASFAQIDSLLQWDQTVNMPPKGAPQRALQLSAIAGVSHDLKTSKELGSILDNLKSSYESSPDLNEMEKAVVRDSLRDYRIETAIPRDLATRIAKLSADSYDAWVQAKTKKDFSIFKPFLQQWVAMSIEKAKLIDPTKPPYEVLMDQYERGLTCKKIDAVFDEIKSVLVPLIAKVQQKPKPNMEFLQHEFDVKVQAKVSEQIARDIGFDFERGRLDVSVHPFTTTIGAASDVRITSRYKPNDLAMGLRATIHETGHALYEQGLDPSFASLPGGQAVSMGIHESQSLFWERMVGMSEIFWKKYWNLISSSFPFISSSSSASDFYRAINKVQAGKVRVEADELTYPLHIILRYEIEEGLISGKIPVDDNLPKLWNKKMEDYLGVTIENDSEGIMQDIHWASGYFGYFPTYTLGAIYASQFYNTAKARIAGLEQQIEQGTFAPLKTWLNENLHVHGSKHLTGEQTCHQLTGEELSAKAFTHYLKEKYSKLYSL